MRKKPMWKIILIAIPIIIVLFLLFAAMQPAEYRVARSVTISAPASVIFPHVNELKKWSEWNPWEKIDPAMKLTYEGPPSGEHASYSWVGNKDVGEGRMTIIESQPNTRIRLKLEFFKPMAGVSTAEFVFRPHENQTEVTWSMTGKNNFIGKIFCLFMNMDKMIGGQFEKGLADLKAAAEKAPTS